MSSLRDSAESCVQHIGFWFLYDSVYFALLLRLDSAVILESLIIFLQEGEEGLNAGILANGEVTPPPPPPNNTLQGSHFVWI